MAIASWGALLLAAAGVGTAAPSYPPAAFAKLPGIERPDISPGGTLIAAQVAVAGKQYLTIVPVDGSAPRYLDLGDSDLNWWHWVNDEWLVVGIGQTIGFQGQDFYVSRAVGISARTKQIVALARDAAQDADDVIWYAHDGSARILLAYQTSVFVNEEGFWPKVDEVDLATGRHRTVEPPREGVMSWFADGAGTVRVGIGHDKDGRSTRVYYRDVRGRPFRTIDRARTRDEHVTVPALFLPDNKALVVEDDDAGLSTVWTFDLSTMKRGQQVFASKGFDVAGLVSDPAGERLLGVATEEDKPATHWLDPDLAALQAEAAALVKGAEIRITSFSSDHARAVVLVGSAEAPGAWMLYDRAGKQLTKLDYVNPAFAMHKMNPVRTIRYKARDGLEIAAVLTLPRGRAAHALPLIVMPHGGPFARDMEQWDWWSQFLAERGYAVVQPNYRGSSGYGTPFTSKGEGQWGLAMQDDLNDAVAALAGQGIADPKRVCMVGASYGGYAALRAAERDGASFRCAVSYAGVSDLGGMKRYDGRFLMAGARGDWLKRQAPDLAAVSPLTHPELFSIPVLIVHGAKDRTVPVRQSRQMASRLRGANKAVTYIEQPLADHHLSREQDRLEFLTALAAFLDQHNPA